MSDVNDDLAAQAEALGVAAAQMRSLVGDVKKAKLRSTLALVVALVVAASVVVVVARVYANVVRKDVFETACQLVNDKAVAPLHRLLDSSKSSASRNPLPADLSPELRAAYERARAEQQKLLDDGLADTQRIDCKALL